MFRDNTIQTTTSSFSSPKQIGNPVMYKLVRVAGDGTLVPATDEEIMEVEDLLENDVNDMHIVTHTDQTVGHISDDGLSSGLPQLESSEAMNPGLSKSENTEASPEKLDYQLESAVKMLQEVEEERLCMTHGTQMLSARSDANIQHSNENQLSGSEDKVKSEALLQESTRGRCDTNQQTKVKPCLNAVGSPEEAALFTSAPKPDFSTVRGEICLDNLSIKALQETFRATFGRETTVKDKLWLKRRIAMGLLNSCFVSATCLTIKDNKLIRDQKDNCNSGSGDSSKDTTDGVRANNSKDALAGPSHQMGGHPGASGNSPRNNFGDPECGGEDFSREHRAAKRLRKPTRRYIEELSETDEKQQSGKSMNPSKDQKLSPKSQFRSIRAASSGGRLVVTRMVSLAGSRMQVPFVSQVRRSRPRENIMALVEFHPVCCEVKATPAEGIQSQSPSQLNSGNASEGAMVKSAFGQVQKEFTAGSGHSKERSKPIPRVLEQDTEPKHDADSSGNSSDENHVGAQMLKSALRRKHHRAWTLSEVVKLVEGVAKYGAGRWSEIKRLSFASQSYRTSVDLKDKWRNLLKASFAQTPSKRMGSVRKHGSMHIPTQILLRVRELAEKQSLVLPVSNTNGDSNRTMKEKRSGFL